MLWILDKYWKTLMWITIIILVASAALLTYNIMTKGNILERDIELSGGKRVTVEVGQVDIAAIEAGVPYKVRLIRGATNNLIVEMPIGADENQTISAIRQLADVRGEPSVTEIGPAIGELFFQQMQVAIIAAFVLMSIIVFILFRSLAPSLAVILAAITDIVVTMAVMSVLNIQLSLATIAALLMLIGYSVDTDIVLTTELLKNRKESNRTINESVRRAMKTGITLTATTLVALIVMYFVSGSLIITQIASVLIIGLLVDLLATWLTNVGILRWYIERKEK